jgi:hypothetical protein
MLMEAIKPVEDKEFIAEARALSELGKIPFEFVLLINYMYELTPDSIKNRKGIIKGCTSFVIRNKAGHVFHGRNLDYGLEDFIPGLYGVGEFYKNGKLIYYGEIIAGYLGFNTGMAPGRFSISLNSRVHPDNSRYNVINGKYLPAAYIIR